MEEVKDMPQSTLGGTCIVCCQAKDSGIRIFSQFICSDCEREIVQTDVQDEKYSFYIDRMKQIWLEVTS